MKTFYFALLAGTLCFAGCKNEQIVDLEKEQIRQERDSLLEASVRKDSAIHQFLAAFNDIEANLSNIRDRQENLTLQWAGNGELKQSIQEKVVEDVKAINELMEENRKKIDALNSTVNSNKIQITELNGMVNVLIQHIKDKNNELVMMNKTLSEKNKELAQRSRIIVHVPH